MKRSITLAAALALGATGATLQAADRPADGQAAPQASIAFVNSGASVREWQADDIQGLWVQDAHRQWYYAKLAIPCHGLDFAVRVGFQTRGADTLDRFSEVVVPGHGRCPIQSFTRSAEPPRG